MLSSPAQRLPQFIDAYEKRIFVYMCVLFAVVVAVIVVISYVSYIIMP